MLMKIFLVTLVGSFSVANAQTPFCSGDLCFIRPDPNSGNIWSAAQQRCKENNSTLPIADNPDHRKSFIDALSHFQLNGRDVWLGAYASDDGPDNWHWLDGSQYIGTDVQGRGEYYKSYAYVAKRTTEVLAYAAPPNNSYSYICQYISNIPDVCVNGTGRTAFVTDDGCYVKYDEKLPWFSARNKCLQNNGDLASFAQLSLLNGIIVDSSEFWVGLRHSHFDWRNGVTGQSSDVTYTSWRIGQPSDAAPHCISTDSSDFPNWRDGDCTYSFSYICQAMSTAASAQATTSTPRPITTSTLLSTSDSRLLRPSSITTTSWPTSRPNFSSPSPQSNNSADPVQAVTCEDSKHNSGVAIGVGIGIPCAIIILALAITVIILQMENRKLRDRLKYKSGDSKVPESKEQRLNLHTSSLEVAGNAGKGNMQYEELQIQGGMQDQREYEQLGREQSQYERVTLK